MRSMNNSRSWQKVGRGNANKLIPLPSAGRHTLFPPPTLCDKQIQRYSRHLLSLNPQIPSEYPYDRNPSFDQRSMELRSRRILSGASFEGQFPKLFLSNFFWFLEVLFGYWENVGIIYFLFFYFLFFLWMGPGGTGSGFDSSCVDYVIHVYLFLFLFILFFNLFYIFIRLMGNQTGRLLFFPC